MVIISPIHDSIVLSYLADFENGQLVLETQSSTDDGEGADILFEGYVTHLFRHEQKGSILFNIEESTFDRFYDDAAGRLEEGRPWDWPIPYQTPDTKAELSAHLRANRCKVYEISASQGLEGWVLAEKMEIIRT